MDDAEIHLRLSACRPHGQDNEDPLLCEAMEKLPVRPELMEWFAEEQKFDRKICKCMGDIPVPEGLCAEILAAAKLNAARPRWQRLPWLASAAAVLLAGLLTLGYYKPAAASPPTLAEFESEIVDLFDSMKAKGFGLDHVSGEFENVSAWLGNQGAPKPYGVKPCTKEARPFGCRTVTWRGQKVAMVCFGREDQGAHLFMVLKNCLQNLPADPIPQKVERVEGYPVATWSCRKYVYVMLGDSPDTELDQFLVASSNVK